MNIVDDLRALCDYCQTCPMCKSIMNESADEIERLRAAIYEHGESPMEQRVQIDPVQYLHTRYVSVTEHNKTYDAFNAEIERLRIELFDKIEELAACVARSNAVPPPKPKPPGIELVRDGLFKTSIRKTVM